MRILNAVSAVTLSMILFQAAIAESRGQVSPDRFEQTAAVDGKGIVDRRCVVCHSCYDAPCQLKLSSKTGLQRGATKIAVYEPSRLRDIDPTRLFLDETEVSGWRRRGFFSVFDRDDGDTLIDDMLDLKARHPTKPEKLPQSFPLDINRELSCPRPDEFGDYAKQNPEGGMPYGMPGLSSEEENQLRAWLTAPNRDNSPLIPEALKLEILKWEHFFNDRTALKHRLVARYLYEHLYLGHLYFTAHPGRLFFRLVRSTTSPAEPIAPIPTVHANDDPGDSDFYYRLQPVVSSIVEKTHMVYPLDDYKLQRFKSLFFAKSWQTNRLPPYGSSNAINPFLTFKDIPAAARYRFLLDNAKYFIDNFIKGPVCRGQVALNVIRDHFYVSFLSPEYDLSVVEPDYLGISATLLAVPERTDDALGFFQQWRASLKRHSRYLAFMDRRYSEHPLTRRGFPIEAIWDGDGVNDNAHLTVFRHFDSASVVKGYVGRAPKTAWVIDYPIFERIFYDLVVNFNVFGNVTHQVLTRLYMDYLRMEAEVMFIAFLPVERRDEVLSDWYQGADAELKIYLAHRAIQHRLPSAIIYRMQDVKQELIQKITERSVVIKEDRNLSVKFEPDEAGGNSDRSAAEQALLLLVNHSGDHIQHMPEVSLLRLSGRDKGKAAVYTLIRNKAHRNVSFIFGESLRRSPEQDYLTVVRGFAGSYPNLFFEVKEAEGDDFVSDLLRVDDDGAFEALIDRFGVRRTDSGFWAYSDWIYDFYLDSEHVKAGLFDLSRYSNF